MMAVEEGDMLMPYEQGSTREIPPTVLDRCLDNPRANILNLLTFCLAMGNAADAVEINCVGFIMTELDPAGRTDKEFLSSAVFFGMFFGGMICGILSDSFGRRPCLLYSLALNTVAGFASVFVPNVRMLIVCRIIGGIGIGGSVPAVFSLGAEIFASSIRGKLLSVIASFWMVGAIFVGGAAWIMLGKDAEGRKIVPGSDWRWFAGVCALPALVAFLLTLFIVPESPRFLIEKLKFDEAATIINRISTLKTTSQELKIEYYVARSNNEMGRKIEAKKSFIPIMFTNKKLKAVTSVLMVIWFTLSFGTYGISTWITTIFADIGEVNPYEDSFIFALATLPGNMVSILLVDKYGRKNLLFFGMVLSGLCTVGFALEKKEKYLVVLCAALFNCFSIIGWNSLDCLSVEMFPTAVRTSAMGFLAASGRIGAVTAQFVNGTLEKKVSLLLLVTSSCMISGGTAAYFLPDDRSGHRLHDCPEVPDIVDLRSEILTPEECDGEDAIANPIMDFDFSHSDIQTAHKESNHGKSVVQNSAYGVVHSVEQ